MDLKSKTCCFTGHRTMSDQEKQIVAVRLRQVIAALVKEGVVYYGAGGALGFDTLAAQTVLEMKKEYPQLRLILVLPCEDQTRNWRSEDIEIYEDIKARCDKVVYVSLLAPGGNAHCGDLRPTRTSRRYTPDSMYKRNRHLVDHSGTCICYLTREGGGTAYTVGYAWKKGVHITNLAEDI